MHKVRDCPCHSGLRYSACCSRYHAGELPETAEALMRSRYAAFALGLGEYLLATLAADHPDRALPHDVLVRGLSQAKERQRFLGLRIVRATEAEVLFDARIFERGKDCSFVELSTFVREDGAWRYSGGQTVPRQTLPASFTYDDFVRARG